MKQTNKNLLIASGIGFFAVLFFIIVRKFLSQDIDTSYDDFHLFSTDTEEDTQHGVEYFY